MKIVAGEGKKKRAKFWAVWQRAVWGGGVLGRGCLGFLWGGKEGSGKSQHWQNTEIGPKH